MTQLDLDFVRAQFPAFSEPSLQGWAFFENAGGSYPARHTVERLTEFYTRLKMQPYAPNPASTEAGQWMDDAHLRMAQWLCVKTEEVMFGPSTTANIYALAHAFRDVMKAGDAVIVADQNHEANRGAWRRMAEMGVEVRDWNVDPETGLLNLDELDNLLDDKTRVVAFPALFKHRRRDKPSGGNLRAGQSGGGCDCCRWRQPCAPCHARCQRAGLRRLFVFSV